MGTTFLSGGLWPRITKLARTCRKAHVAVAFCGKNAPRLLPLPKGSVLVVDFSDGAVRGGNTHPLAIQRFINKDIDVHSWQGLHAKVFVFGRRAIIGSSNVSAHSAKTLLEAAVETTDPEVVAAAREFVRSHRGDYIGLEHAKQMKKLFPTVVRPIGGGRRSAPPQPPIWIFRLVREAWGDEDKKQDRKARPLARKRISDSKRFKIEEFLWWSDPVYSSLKRGDSVLQVTTEGKKQVLVTIPAKVIWTRRYDPRGKRKILVYTEVPKNVRRRNLKQVLSRLGPMSRPLRNRRRSQLIKDQPLIRGLRGLWAGAASR